MSTNSEADFPVGFAEQKDQIEADTVFYVEWLDNNSEFPGLAFNECPLNGDNWELLRRNEIDDEDHTCIMVEDDSWSKLSKSNLNQLYAAVVEKNAAELQPTKRAIQPLWPNTKTKKTIKVENIEDVYEEDLALDLNDVHKSQYRRAHKLTSRRKLHDLKIVDLHVEGILNLATSHHNKTRVDWVPYQKDLSNFDRTRLETYTDGLLNSNISDRDIAIRYSARFSHNTKRYLYNYFNKRPIQKRSHFPDNEEYSVQARIVG
ncbi:hypothetical protein INT47_004128 [Mucor saturninus]|uniref:Uncharacterized protein n=1 Tax=Mucor saturninus TaxID=64648 RepID=A0A8H7UUQ9_9FUNG|nr:hypothetical protein INT47_004128 [Mucor saturninus]